MHAINAAMNALHEGDTDPLRILAHIDLRLLLAFEALVRESSVTRAADRMGVTQSAMSHTLRRIREVFGDPILVRGQGGWVPSARAEALARPVRGSLMSLGRALQAPPRFEPAKARRQFRLASLDLFDTLVLPSLMAQLWAESPQSNLTVLSAQDPKLSERLETGDIDAAVLALPQLESQTGVPDLSHPGLVRRTLFRDHFVCLLRAEHPALEAAEGLSLSTYLELDHLLVSPSGSGPGLVDRSLDAQGLHRRIAVRVPHFGAAPRIAEQSDLVLTAPSALARVMGSQLRLRVVPPPLSLPEHSVNLVWHERFTTDPAHRWFRDKVEDIPTDLKPSPGFPAEPPSQTLSPSSSAD